ncbi:MAG: hypothetical protein KDM91_22250, partial [Verrucomicrobiae bacterium]|nr:hypothetical protein [Verrucomicrobiae bacterium]
ITVVVAGDMTMVAASTPDMTLQPVYQGLVQVGHGGPGVDGQFGGSPVSSQGDVTVLVGGNLTTVDGSGRRQAGDPEISGNNYVMVGNGDWLRDGDEASTTGTAPGQRIGDITVATGNNANLSGALVGHGQAAANIGAPTIGTGDTYIAVSRTNPFYGGLGTLTTDPFTVFTSGGFGNTGELRLYAPARSNMDGLAPGTNMNGLPFNYDAIA